MRVKKITVFAAVTLMASLGVAQATGYLALRCHADHDGSASSPVAEEGGVEASGTDNAHFFPVAETENGESFLCEFTVPADYDLTGGFAPWIDFYGWLPPGEVCGIDTSCVLPDDVQWEITHRIYTDGSDLDTSWTEANSTNQGSADSANGVACTSQWCWPGNKVIAFQGDAADDDDSWGVGRLVQLRILRDSDLPDYTGTFHVAVGAVTLAYPN